MSGKLQIIWTDHDFEIMNWHDVVVHAMAITTKEYDYELMFDIDYIFEWRNPVAPDNSFSFNIAPATLVFSGVWDIATNIATRDSVLEPLCILDIQRQNPRNINNCEITTWDWTIILIQGTIKFNGPGFTQYIRHKPINTSAQELLADQRGPLSFGRKYVEA